MRGEDEKQTAMYSYVKLAQGIPVDHLVRWCCGYFRAPGAR
jgi:hypothetical protein